MKKHTLLALLLGTTLTLGGCSFLGKIDKASVEAAEKFTDGICALPLKARKELAAKYDTGLADKGKPRKIRVLCGDEPQ